MEHRRRIAVLTSLKYTAAADFGSDPLILFTELSAADWFFRTLADKSLCCIVFVIESIAHHLMNKTLTLLTDMAEYLEEG